MTNNTSLTTLSAGDNNFTSLDLNVNTELSILSCYSNNLTSLDLSNNVALTRLECNYNELTYLNMRNGVDSLIVFNAANNPNLLCIETLDPASAALNWT